MKHIIAVDLGTTGNRVIAFDHELRVVSSVYKELTQIYPKPGWVEHDPNEIYNAVVDLIEMTYEKLDPKETIAIGITNQRETVVAWDKETGKPYYNAIVWQDCRTEALCKKLLDDKEFADYVQKNTGLKVDPYFSASKMKWILDNVKINDNLLFGTIDSWIIWKLSGQHVTDHTNASRTMLYNLRTGEWDKYLLEKFGISVDSLATLKDSSGIVARYKDIPIAGIAGDQQASLFGHRCFSAGEMKNTYGTGCFCLMNTGEKIVISKHGLISTVAISINKKRKFALEGSVFIAGAAIQWLRDSLSIIKTADEATHICKSVNDTHGVYFVPAFAGLGTPHWRTDVRGTISGLTRSANRNHIVRAAVEAIAYQSRDMIDLMDHESGLKCKILKADGGATKNDFLMQFQADLLNAKISVPEIKETTALGAAMLAGLAVGFWKGHEELSNIKLKSNNFNPSKKREHEYREWKIHVDQIIK